MERTPIVAAVDSDAVPTTPNPPSPPSAATSAATSATRSTAPEPASATTVEPAGPPDEPAGPAEPQPSSSVAGRTSPDTPAARFTLHRSRTDRMISGVCGGLAESLAVDAALVRIGLVVLTLLAFPLGPVVYVAIWILAPEQ